MSTTNPSLLERIAPLFPYPAEMTALAISDHLECSIKDACDYLSAWHGDKRVERIRRGVYRLSRTIVFRPRVAVMALADKGSFTAADAEAATGLTGSGSRSLLARMVADGQLTSTKTRGLCSFSKSADLPPEPPTDRLTDAAAFDVLMSRLAMHDCATRSIPKLIRRTWAETKELLATWEREGWIANSVSARATVGPRWLLERRQRAAEGVRLSMAAE